MSVDSTKPSGRSQLLEWIERNDLSRTEVATRFGVTPPALARWLNGKRRPRYRTLLFLRDLTGIPVDSWSDPDE